MTHLVMRLLGSFQVSVAARPITKFESDKVRALLAYLATEHDQAHRRDELAGLFWPDMPDSRARSNLSQALYNLRKLLQDHNRQEPTILRWRDAVQFNTRSDSWVDANQFTRIMANHRQNELDKFEILEEILDEVQAAVALYRGDFLEGVPFVTSQAFEEWKQLWSQRLQRQALVCLSSLATFYAQRNAPEKALPFTWRQIEIDPINENAYRLLMQLLVDTKQRSQAMAQFDRLSLLLAEEMGISPEIETIELYERIRGDSSRLSAIASIPEHTPHNLPAFLTPLVGRKSELASLQQQIQAPYQRLITILGPGGSGKSRLALEVARASLENFNHGVFFVQLNPVQSPESILPAIVEALGLTLQKGDDYQVQLSNYLRYKRLLLVLDGFEHLLAGAGLMRTLLKQAPEVKMLVTSRVRLNIKGEQLFYLHGLETAPVTYSDIVIGKADSTQLFINCMRRLRPDYQPNLSELVIINQICHQVQGMPLAILLAASWGATLSIEDIFAEIEHGLDFLSADWSDLPSRQRSLRTTFEYSWKLFSPSEQKIFKNLSVFRGSFSRQAAGSVSGTSAHELRALVDKSALSIKSPGRYEMHELMRQFGVEKLCANPNTEPEMRQQHSAYYSQRLERLKVDLTSSQQKTALLEIDTDHENFRSACEWNPEHASLTGLLPGFEALCLYYEMRLRYREGESLCSIAAQTLTSKIDNPINAPCDRMLHLANVLTWHSRFKRLLGKGELAAKLIQESQAIYEQFRPDDPDQHPDAQRIRAFMFFEQAEHMVHLDRRLAENYFKESMQLYRTASESWGVARCQEGLGIIAHHAGTFGDAVIHCFESLEIYSSLGDPTGTANSLINLGHNLLRQGQNEAGENFIQEGVKLLQQIGDRAGVARGFLELGRIDFWKGDFEKSVNLCVKSQPIFEELGMLDRFVFITISIGLGLSQLGKYQEARKWILRGLPFAQDYQAQREIAMAYLLLGMSSLGQGDYNQAYEWVQKSIQQYHKINQKDELCWALAELIFIQRKLGQSQEAWQSLRASLKISLEVQGLFPILCELLAASLLLFDRGETERALELASVACNNPIVANSIWFEHVALQEIKTLSEYLPPGKVAAAQERGSQRELWQTAAELLDQQFG